MHACKEELFFFFLFSSPQSPRHTENQSAMSFFMNQAANQSVNMQNMAMAEQELEMVSDLFNRYGIALSSHCHGISRE